jgi:hypothetical protein
MSKTVNFEKWRNKKIDIIQEKVGCSRETARQLFLAKPEHWQNEPAVMQAAIKLACFKPEVLYSAPPSGGGLGRWCEKNIDSNDEMFRLSCPRTSEAIELALKLLELPLP